MFRRIRVAVDPIKGGDRVMATAIEWARGLHATLRVVALNFQSEVREIKDLRRQGLDRLKELCRSQGVEATFQVEEVEGGNEALAPRICRHARGCDLILMGHGKYDRIYRFVHQSTAQDLINLATIPVAVVPQSQDMPPPSDSVAMKRILVPVNPLRKEMTKVGQVAIRLARQMGTEVHLITALFPGDIPDIVALKKNGLKRFAELCRKQNIPVTYEAVEVPHGSDSLPAYLAQLAKTYDLLVMGHQRYDKAFRFVHQSTAQDLINSAPVPVVVVPD
ncbi:MAG: universal stress protein [Euryarchaeota archaeon]|nr:universal stress protein [Euryarchaeota archaeon]